MKKSVRFWRKILIACILALIALPYGGVVLLSLQNAKLRDEIEAKGRSCVDAVTSGTTSYDAAAIVRQKPLLSYQLLYPEMKASFSGFNDDLVNPKTVFLTFDDGPSTSTLPILDILKKHGIRATFFVNGKSSVFASSWLKQIAKDGNTVGMHSYTHQYPLIYASVENCIEDLNKNFLYIKNTTGISPTLVRFPGGASTPTILKSTLCCARRCCAGV